ncbi:MAG TPA: N-carbamoylputrescine amidase [Xanthomonadales bacterium]|nr:N-carbamoylputrescine amidase [Xanthomonadales bacterium]
MRVNLACTQMACTWDLKANVDRAEKLVRDAAKAGANIVLIQELFESPYFCIDQQDKHFDLASTREESATIRRFQTLAKELNVVLPVSWFERSGQAFYNSVVVVDSDGSIAGHYRKSHIPQFPAYEEKYYFSPGDTGFKAVQTQFGCIGVGICWDQWFPEAARAMVLQGAEILLYPTAIGSELYSPELDSKDHWQTVMRGHAAANVVPVVASNRIGTESSGELEMQFYGSSFITDYTGGMMKAADRETEGFLLASIELDEAREYRRSWGVFRDRRPDLYGPLTTLDGKTRRSIRPA